MENPIKKPRTAWTVEHLADWLAKYDTIHKETSLNNSSEPYDKETWRIIVQNVALDYVDSINETEVELVKGLCPHRHEVTFSFTVTGFGDTKEDAIQEARDYAIKDWLEGNSVESFEAVKAVYANDADTCDTCEEEE